MFNISTRKISIVQLFSCLNATNLPLLLEIAADNSQSSKIGQGRDRHPSEIEGLRQLLEFIFSRYENCFVIIKIFNLSVKYCLVALSLKLY